ncbi:Trimethyllysine dioxygenase [Nemania sp. FL0916]|nr:Trimethyllysine dioxygenase [Nemania sp. FL0916]
MAPSTLLTSVMKAHRGVKKDDASKAVVFVDEHGSNSLYVSGAARAQSLSYGQSTYANYVLLSQYFWLRDNCRCDVCVNQDTRQRNFNTFELPESIEPSRMMTNESGLEIHWSHDSHVSFYSWGFLEPYMRGDRPKAEDVPISYFGANGHPDSNIHNRDFEENEKHAVGRLADMIKRNGFVIVTGVPTDSAKPTEDLLRKIAFIRETHYGGFYDFTPDLAHADTAYTNLALAAHTDTTYFSDPAGLQALHLLSHVDPSSQGGTGTSLGGRSLLVDGFRAAEILKREDPDSFDVLAGVGIPWHASGNEGITISPDKLYPVLEYDTKRKMMHRVRWNNDDRGVVPLGGKFSEAQWYKAARKWNEILRREELVYWFQLEPGNVLIFDNWRVLHGRSAFTGIRRMCGGYINRDDFVSRWRNTNYPRDQILQQVIGYSSVAACQPFCNFPHNNMPTPQSDSVMSLFSLKGRTAIVSGAGAGIGLAVAHALAEAGADVAIWYNSNKKAIDEAANIEAKFDVKCRAYQVNIGSYDSVKGTVDEIVREFNGRLDVFVANSGIAWEGGAFIDEPLDTTSNVLRVNLEGTLYCARAAALHWRRQRQEGTTVDGKALDNYLTGSFICTASMSGSIVNIPQTQAVYNASKAAVIHACKSLAIEWTGFARANSVSPGYIKTELVAFISDDLKNVINNKVPMGREGEPRELKGAYLYLASDASSYVTGTDLLVDGGYCAP